MKKNYRLMSYAEMAEFIKNMEPNKVYSFVVNWNKNGNGTYSYGYWYGIVKHKVFETTVITMGIFGGGAVSSFDYGWDVTTGKIEHKFSDYINSYVEERVIEDKVIVDTEPC